MGFILRPVRTNCRRDVTQSELLFRMVALLLCERWMGWKGTRQEAWSLVRTLGQYSRRKMRGTRIRSW